MRMLQHPYRFETDVPRLNRIVQNCGCKVRDEAFMRMGHV